MDFNFDSIAGYAKEKAELKRICDIFNNKEKYEARGAKLPKGLIFYGETGTGKTLFAKVMASVCKLKVFKISLGSIDNETAICGIVKRTFEEAANCGEQAMIFFDELDKVLPDYTEEYVTDVSKAVCAQLLTLIDGMDSTNNIVFVATCNYYSSLPSTLTRPGRIDRKIGIGLPSFSSRMAILNMYAKQTTCKFEMSMEEIASLTNGFSCAALETLINECILQSDDNGFVSKEQTRTRFFEIENEDIMRSRSQLDERVDACRNAGGLVAARSLDDSDYTLTMETYRIGTEFFNSIFCHYSSNFDNAQDDVDYDDDYDEDYDDDGYYGDEDDDEEDFDACDGATVFSKEDFLNAITVCMAGPAAEEVILHKTYNNVKHLYDVSYHLLFAMVGNGMLGLSCMSVYVERDYIGTSDARKDVLCQSMEKTLEKCYLRAKDLISKNEALVRDLMSALVDQQTLNKEQCEKIFAAHGGVIL